jgi:serine/threonine-protein kinase
MSQHPKGTSEDTLAWAAREQDEEPYRDLTGTTLGDFQVNRLLGRGGMGEVYLAIQLSLNRSVALKVLHPHFLSKPAYLSRFEAEATAVAKLNHPNIVHVYTLGHVDQIRFIAMEYVEGTNLREYIIKKGALELPLALSVMRQAGQAIGVAGEVGLIHRDIKPENLLITRKGRVKVADFGLCRDMGSDRFHVTQPGITMGTPLYMSPEQAQGRALDHRSDLYSLGVTFYHMLTGAPPFRAESAIALAMKHVNDPPVSPRVHRPEIPIELERLVLKLMAKNPADRFQSAAEMLAELAKIRSTLQTTPNGIVGAETAAALARGDDFAVTPAFDSAPQAATLSRLPAVSPSTLGRWLTSPFALALTAGIFLLVGAALGWSSRPPGLPAGDELANRKLPGVGIEPRWKAIPKQASAEEQYRFAQLRAAGDDLAAAWLAVPGYHGRSAEWVSPSYVQVARLFYRRRDIDRLSVLGAQLAAWPGAKTTDKELAEIVEAAVKMLGKDLDGVIEAMSRVSSRDDRTIYDPGLLEFSGEIVADAIGLAGQPGTVDIKRDKLGGIQGRLMRFLRRVRLAEWAGR